MQIWIEPEVWESRTGWLARDASFQLCAYGTTPESAISELEQGIKAWCRALQKEGILAEALNRSEIRFRDGVPGLHIEIT